MSPSRRRTSSSRTTGTARWGHRALPCEERAPSAPACARKLCCFSSYAGSKTDVAADDALQMAVLSAQEQGAVIIERFRFAADHAITDFDFDMLAKSDTARLPFVAERREGAAANEFIVAVQFPEQRGGKVCAANVGTRLNFQGGRNSPQFSRQVGFREIHVNTDSKHDMIDSIQFRREFRQDAGSFPATN